MSSRGAIKITLLPVKSESKKRSVSTHARIATKTPSDTGLREICGLLVLCLCMIYEAHVVNSSVSIPDDIKDYLLGGLLVGAFILGRNFAMVQLQQLGSSMSRLQSSFHKSLNRVATLENNLSEAWKKSTSNLNKQWNAVVVQQKDNKKQTNVLSASNCFVSLELVEKLSLVDVTRLFQYAMDFNKNKVKKQESSALLKQVLEAMDRATSTSGGDSSDTTPDDSNDSSDSDPNAMDALLLCAALRIFAEWRVLRQVPKSFNKSYEMGMSLGRRDLIQNISKMETAIHQYMDSHSNRRPTIQDLLEHEVSYNVHQALPKLFNESAAMGLLWAKRQVDYQASIYSNLMENQQASTAVKTAYKQVFDPYHGWIVKQLFSQSFRSAPPAMEIYKKMVSEHDLVVESRTASIHEEPVPYWAESSCSSFDESNMSDVSFSNRAADDSMSIHSRHQDELIDHYESHQEPSVECQLFGLDLWDKASKHVQNEWDKFIEGTVALFQGKPQRLTAHAVQQHDSRTNLFAHVDRRSAFAALKPHQDPIEQVAHQHFSIFLNTAKPMIRELDTLLNKYNMNDPTKV